MKDITVALEIIDSLKAAPSAIQLDANQAAWLEKIVAVYMLVASLGDELGEDVQNKVIAMLDSVWDQVVIKK